MKKGNNTGCSNTGGWNTGGWNTGDYNTGGRNTGCSNTGCSNTGGRNTGHRNTGDYNTGCWNTGGWNTGDYNTGGWNTGHRNTGYFNTETPKNILVFGKNCDRDLFDNCHKPDFLFFNITKWILEKDMTQEEKDKNPTYSTTGGYLKKYDYKEAFKKSWDEADKEDRVRIKDLPNFCSKMFFEISGIKVDECDVRDERKKEILKKIEELKAEAENL